MIIVLMGVSGSGKTVVGEALAARLGAIFVEGDALHSSENVAKMSRGIPLTEADRVPWLQRVHARMAELRAEGCDGVIACSALSRHSRQLLGVDDPDVLLVHLSGSRQVIAERLASRRGHYMPASLLDSQFAALELPTDAVIIDVDQSVDQIVQRIIEAIDARRM